MDSSGIQPRSASSAGDSDTRRLPRHIGVIADGNRRWATLHRKPVGEGYRIGASRLIEFLGWRDEAEVPMVTAWLVTEVNVSNRPPEQIARLLEAIDHLLWDVAQAGRWRLAIIGDLALIPSERAASYRRAAGATAERDGPTFVCGLAHSGRTSIIEAATTLFRAGKADITAAAVSDYLTDHHQPDLDLIIRSSGEQRISDMGTWQAAWSELFYCDCLWPDFSRHEFDEALAFYSARCRRFGS